MSMHQNNCQCSDCQDERLRERNQRWVKKLSPEDRRAWQLIQRSECPECGGKKPEGEACQDCGFRYVDKYPPLKTQEQIDRERKP